MTSALRGFWSACFLFVGSKKASRRAAYASLYLPKITSYPKTHFKTVAGHCQRLQEPARSSRACTAGGLFVTGVIKRVAALLLSSSLAGCAFTDQFSPRIYSSNVNSQASLDQETLLNIVRASRYQPLTFVAIGKTAGSQTADLKVGLPTLTFGAGQTLAQRQLVFANNSIDNNAVGSFESNPLISSAFQMGMLTPVSPKIMAMLLGAYPREPIFYALLDGIKLTSARNSWYFKNDPSNNAYGGKQNNPTCHDLEVLSRYGAEHSKAVTRLALDYNQDCNFSEFAYLLEFGLAVGLTAELDNSPAKEKTPQNAKDSSKTATAADTSVKGYMCFDPSLARLGFKTDAMRMENRCGTKTSSPKIVKKFNFDGTLYDVELRFRSPVGIYAFLGKLLRDGTAAQIHMQDPALGDIRMGEFIDIDQQTVDCLLSGSAIAAAICRPRASTANTLIMMAMLEHLRNLMISPADINASFSVRLAD
jgi:hypothetical protein